MTSKKAKSTTASVAASGRIIKTFKLPKYLAYHEGDLNEVVTDIASQLRTFCKYVQPLNISSKQVYFAVDKFISANKPGSNLDKDGDAWVKISKYLERTVLKQKFDVLGKPAAEKLFGYIEQYFDDRIEQEFIYVMSLLLGAFENQNLSEEESTASINHLIHYFGIASDYEPELLAINLESAISYVKQNGAASLTAFDPHEKLQHPLAKILFESEGERYEITPWATKKSLQI